MEFARCRESLVRRPWQEGPRSLRRFSVRKPAGRPIACVVRVLKRPEGRGPGPTLPACLGLERHVPEEDFRALALQEDFPPSGKHAARLIHCEAVEPDCDVVLLANADEFVPLSARFLHVVRAAEIEFIL